MLSVDRPSTECRPITDRYIGQVSTNYRPTIGEVSVNEKLYRPRHIWNDYRSCLDRVSTHYRPLYRPISRSTLPTVNKILVLFMIQVKEVAIIGPASFRSRHEMLSRPVALFGDYLPNNFNTSVVEVCFKLKVVETGFM